MTPPDPLGTSAPKILVVDDEPQIRRFLGIALTANGFQVIDATGVREAVGRCATALPDAVVLDLGLADGDGMEVLSRIREWSQVPILVLSVRSAEADKVRALDAGADDYVVKPFSPAELVARIRVALRRQATGNGEPPLYTHGELCIDLARRQVSVGGRNVALSRKEYALLAMLARSAGRVVTQPQLLEAVWGPAHREDTHYLRIYIRQLRQKLGDNAEQPRWIGTEPGVGYRLAEPAPEPAP